MEKNLNTPIFSLPLPSSEFLNTVTRIEMDNPIGLLFYLDFNLENSETPNSVTPLLSLVTKQKTVCLESFKVASTIASNTIADIESYHGIDMTTEISSALLREDTINLEKLLYSKYLELGLQSPLNNLTKWQKLVSKVFKKLKFPIYVSSENLCMKLISIANKMGAISRRGSANFIIVNPYIASCIQDDKMFEFSKQHNYTNNFIYHVGNIGDRLKVFVNSSLPVSDTKIVFGKKSSPNEPGVFWTEASTKLHIRSIDIEETPTGKKLFLRSRRAIVHTPGSEKLFFCDNFIINKKPWWRKLFKL